MVHRDLRSGLLGQRRLEAGNRDNPLGLRSSCRNERCTVLYLAFDRLSSISKRVSIHQGAVRNDSSTQAR